MTVLVFSRSPNAQRMKFPRRPRTGPQVEVEPIQRMKRLLPLLEQGRLVYLDMAGLGEVERRRALAALCRRQGIHIGVIDPLGKVTDVSGLFHAGIVDYMGREYRRTGLTARRLERVMAFVASRGAGSGPVTAAAPAAATAAVEAAPAPRGEKPAPDGWTSVVPGREHSFAFLFVEVDGVEVIKRRCGADNLSRAMETFRTFIERMVGQHGGRLWTWGGFGGLLLFPQKPRATAGDGEQAGEGQAVLCMLRIALSRVLYDVEECPLPASLGFRMALSGGSMVYRETDTGGVIAESLNAIFHLGQKFARPGTCVLTEEALRTAPERLRALCVPQGRFEGRRVFRMTLPRYPASPREGEWQAGD